jgi:hypothetical protein
LQKDITIKNVYTEHSLSQFIRLDNDPGTTHKVDGLQFINWNVDFANGGQNLLQYSSGYIKNVKFQNFIVNGECLHSFVNAQSQYNFK